MIRGLFHQRPHSRPPAPGPSRRRLERFADDADERALSIRASMPTGFPELFDLQRLDQDGRPAIDNRHVRSKLANWATKSNGLKCTSYRAMSALSRGERPGTGELYRQAGRGRDHAGHFAIRARTGRPMGALQERRASTGPACSWPCSCVRRPPASRAAPTKFSRNIIAERVLSLPADIRVDKTCPSTGFPTRGRWKTGKIEGRNDIHQSPQGRSPRHAAFRRALVAAVLYRRSDS